jgi:hypothetical protein
MTHQQIVGAIRKVTGAGAANVKAALKTKPTDTMANPTVPNMA